MADVSVGGGSPHGPGDAGPTPETSTKESRPGTFVLANTGNGVGLGGTGQGVGGGGPGAGGGFGGNGQVGASGARNGSGLLAGGGRGGSGESGLGDLLSAIRRRIERAKVYPEAARRTDREGTVDLRFRIGPDGSAERVEILRSSGHESLDESAILTIRRAAPYPLLAGWIRIPLAYRLER